jgi:hypothetical protein
MRQDGARDVEQTHHIGVENTADLFGAALFNRACQAITGVVDKHVDAAEMLNRQLDGLKRRGLAGDIEVHSQQAGLRAEYVGYRARFARRGDHGVTLSERRSGDLGAHSARCAGDHPDALEACLLSHVEPLRSVRPPGIRLP